MITAERIKRFAPSARADLVEAMVEGWHLAEAAGITTPLRLQHFMAELAVETGGLHAVEEGLSYSTAARIRATWPKRFKTDAAAQPFVRQPKALAIKVYGGRMGNAPAPSDDGWRFRGGGMLQTTGREGYRKAGFEEHPEALRSPARAFEVAVAEWKRRGCNKAADRDDVVAVRKLINGGTIGIDLARTYLAKAKRVFVDEPAAAPRRPAQEPVQADEPDPAPAPAPVAPEPAPTPSPAPTQVPEPHPEPIAPTVTAKDLKAAGSRTITGAWSVKLKAWWGMIGGGLTAVVTGVGDFFGDTWDKLQPIRDVATHVPGWVWGVIVVVLSYLLWRAANKVEKARVADEAVLRTRS